MPVDLIGWFSINIRLSLFSLPLLLSHPPPSTLHSLVHISHTMSTFSLHTPLNKHTVYIFRLLHKNDAHLFSWTKKWHLNCKPRLRLHRPTFHYPFPELCLHKHHVFLLSSSSEYEKATENFNPRFFKTKSVDHAP
jgi:hypothetical protein